MSILLATEIEKAFLDKRIIINPYTREHIGPNSYDVTLADTLITYVPLDTNYEYRRDLRYSSDCNWCLDMKEENKHYTYQIPSDGIILYPGILYLGSTNEAIGSDFFHPMYDGRSSTARLGIQSHISAGFGDVGFKSRWTLEITVVHPIRIYKDVRIGQVFFNTVNQNELSLVNLYKGKYSDQANGPVVSKMFKDKEFRDDCFNQ